MADDAQLPLRYFEMLRHLQQDDDPQGPQQATVHTDPAAQGLAADRLRALLVRPPAAPDVPLPKQGPLDWFMKAAMLAQGALGINEPKPEEFKTPEDLQQAKNYYGPAAMAGVLLGGPGAMGAVEKGVSALRGAEEAAPAVKQGIRAYHGSPHDFEQFDAAHIGSGEGNAAYGHGLYFAEAEPTAESYRMRGRPVTANPSTNVFRNMFENRKLAGLSDEAAFQQTKDWAAANPQLGSEFASQWPDVAAFKKSQGTMYEVNIKASPDEFLDLHKPLSEQAQHIQDHFNEFGIDNMSLTGAEAYSRLGGSEGQEGASMRMTEGAKDAPTIKGHHFLDQFSRGTGEGTRNYVVYPGNEHLIEIMKKYGVALPVAAEIYRRQQAQAHEPGADSSTPFTLSK
jgi:hypothetical protein